MDDALKILCRSTTISRKTSKAPAKISRPSSGEAKNPQLFGRSLRGEHVADEQESRKRKREEGSPSVQQGAELDFFHKQTTKKAPGGDASDWRIRNVASNNIAEEQQYGEEVAKDLPQDECRRILKSHKIRITDLEPAEEEPAAVPETKRKLQKNKSKESENMDAKKKKKKLDITLQPLTAFSQLRSRFEIDAQLARNIEEQGYKIPTEVQLGALPILLKSDKRKARLPVVEDANAASTGHTEIGLDVDLLTVAPTGSGKTLAFLIPVLNFISKQKTSHEKLNKREILDGPSAIIVAPTKELAAQIVSEARKLAQKTGVTVSRVRKKIKLWLHDDSEADQGSSEKSADSASASSSDEGDARTAKPQRRVADILVTTPLILVNVINAHKAGTKALRNVRHLVLDEADVLLDPMFRSQTLKIWESCTNARLRVSLWSATMGSNIEDLAKATILEHRQNRSSRNQPPQQIIRLVVGLKDSAIPSVQHKLIYCANEAGKLLAMRQLLRPSRPSAAPSTTSTPAIQPPFLVFTQTIPRAIALASELRYDIPAQASLGSTAGATDRLAVLHADLSDAARASTMARFRAADIWVLITTDLLARGVDFRGVNAVVNYDLPTSSAAYVHRVGRTGRAGREGGVAVTLYAEEDVPVLKNVVNVVKAAESAAVGRDRGAAGAVERATQDWLVRSLPKVSKREKQRLKQRGVEARRAKPDARVVGRRQKTKTRISTKSGYERRLEHRRKGFNAAEREGTTADEER